MPSACYRTPFASPHSSSSLVAVPIRIITTGPTSRGRVFQRCIGQLTRRALLLGHGTARRPKNSSHHPSSWVDQRGQGILHTRRRPRALFLVSSIRATSSRTTHHPPFPSTKIRIRAAFRTAAELSNILDDSLSCEFGKPGGRRRTAGARKSTGERVMQNHPGR